MMRNKDYNWLIKFKKTIEDLYFDSSSGIFQPMGEQDDGSYVFANVPQFVQDEIYDLDLLDITFYDKYSERFLNKTGGNAYSVLDDELVNPDDLSMIVQQILNHFSKKWDNLYYLYYKIIMGTDYNPIENYSSDETTTFNDVTDERTKDGSDTDTTTFTNLIDELKKSGTETNARNAEVKQKPLKTVTKISDEYGENGLNGIKDKTTFNRDYTDTNVSGKTSGGTTTPFRVTDEKQIAGFNSSGYADSEKNTRDETGQKETTHKDGLNSTEETERTGKHSSLNESGGEIQNGAVVQGDLQVVSSLDKTTNYDTLSFSNDRTDTNTRNGEIELEHAYDSTDTNVKSGSISITKTGNIGVMTASQMLESAWNGELARNFLDVVFKDVADFISLQCY